MRVMTAFFAGVGTVGVAIAGGLGGGLLLGNIMSPQQPKHPSSEVTRLEQQRASQQPIQAMNGAPQPVPYMATPQVAATAAEPPAQPPPQQTPQPQQAQPQVQQASTQPVEQKPPERNPPAQSNAAAQPAAAPVEQPAARERATPEDALAKARDGDIRRDAGRTEDRDRRKAERRQQWDERRQQWVEKRKWRQRQDDDLRDVEASVRETTESRPMFGREPRVESRERGFGSRDPGFFGGRESGSGSGRFGLFDD